MPILDPPLPLLKAWRLRYPGRIVFANQDGVSIVPNRQPVGQLPGQGGLHRIRRILAPVSPEEAVVA